MTTGAYVLCAAVAIALIVGGWRRFSDGRFAPAGPTLDESSPVGVAAELVASLGAELGERATLVQFSSAFCAPCRTTRVVLAAVADEVDGVVHVEVDAELNLDATRSLGILRTPTTLVLDPSGHEVARASGVPTRDQVLGAVARA